MSSFKKLIVKLLLRMGYSIRRSEHLIEDESLIRTGRLFRFLYDSADATTLSIAEASKIVQNSKSQLGQDVLALSVAGIGKSGFFVEFGASNGLEHSNTHLLEKHYGWNGILCEPARSWHAALRENRSCAIDTRCVYSSSGKELSFSETTMGSLSTITSFMASDLHKVSRKTSSNYEIESISLMDLLAAYDAPKHINFLSIDTEGSEFEILNAFDFSKYSFGLICVEHNYTENRSKISTLLTTNGYTQIYAKDSLFDDWYVGPARTN
jgi:FkbM family methyltransferase